MRRDALARERGHMNRNPLLIISALLASLGPLVGNGLYAGPDGTGQQRLDEIRDGLPGIAYAGFPLELAGLLATAVIIAWLTHYLYPRTPVAAVATAVAGAAMLAVKVGSAAPIMVAIDQADKLDVRTTDVLYGLNDAAFVIDGLFFSVTFVAAGIGLLKTTTPRWLAWWPVVAGAFGTLAAGVGILEPDAYFPVPFLLLLMWMIALAIASAMSAGPTSGTTQSATFAETSA
jgi:hypothetical protein